MKRHTPLSGVFGIENATADRHALQRAIDRIVAIIQNDPHKERTDAIITRWLKRHLQWLGAGVNLDRLNSLVEDKDTQIAEATGLSETDIGVMRHDTPPR